MKLSEKLYSLRKKNGYTQAELAEILGVSRQSVSNWELGTIQPSTSRLRKLSELCTVPLEELLDEGVEVQLHIKPTTSEVNKNLKSDNTEMNCTPFVRQYVILNNKWGALLCQKEYRTRDILQNSKKLL